MMNNALRTRQAEILRNAFPNAPESRVQAALGAMDRAMDQKPVDYQGTENACGVHPVSGWSPRKVYRAGRA